MGVRVREGVGVGVRVGVRVTVTVTVLDAGVGVRVGVFAFAVEVDVAGLSVNKCSWASARISSVVTSLGKSNNNCQNSAASLGRLRFSYTIAPQ